MAIKSIKHKELRKFFTTGKGKINPEWRNALTEILAALDAISNPHELEGWRKFHPFTGPRKGGYAVRVTGNWRVTWEMDGSDVISVDLEDYH